MDKLASYGISTGLIKEDDRIYVINSLLKKLDLESYEASGEVFGESDELSEILSGINDYAVSKGLIENDSVVYRDIFDTYIMDTLTPYPSTIVTEFNKRYEKSAKDATDAGLTTASLPSEDT
ncbi:MAG: hypothetical protein ACI3XQ_13025 [Eubacteriales bacterium]